MRGLVHIYCGDGKGKTTAAIGSAVRAGGRGRRVLVCRFLKTDDSGEVHGLSQVPGVTVLPCKEHFGFSWEMTPDQKKSASAYYTDQFLKAWDMALGQGQGSAVGESVSTAMGKGGGIAPGQGQGNAYDMLVLDEIIGACGLGFVNEEIVIQAISSRPEHMEVILTGRDPSKPLLELGDYVTEMTMVRHPYEQGIGAREGIEY